MPVFQPRGDQPGAFLSPDSFSGFADSVGAGLKDFERSRIQREQERLTGRQVKTQENLAEETARRTDIMGQTEDRLATGQQFDQQMQGLTFAISQAGFVLDAEGNPSLEGASALIEGRGLPEGYTFDSTGVGNALAQWRKFGGDPERFKEITRNIKEAEGKTAVATATKAGSEAVGSIVDNVNKSIAALGPEAQSDPKIRAKLTEAFKSGDASKLDGIDFKPETPAGQKLSEFTEMIGLDPANPEDRAFSSRYFKEELVTRPTLMWSAELDLKRGLLDLYKTQADLYKGQSLAMKIKALGGTRADPVKVDAIVEKIDGQIRDQQATVMGLRKIKVGKKWFAVEADDVVKLLSGPQTREAIEAALDEIARKHDPEGSKRIEGFGVASEKHITKGAKKLGKGHDLEFEDGANREAYVTRILEARQGTAAMAAHLASLRKMDPEVAAIMVRGNPVLEAIFGVPETAAGAPPGATTQDPLAAISDRLAGAEAALAKGMEEAMEIIRRIEAGEDPEPTAAPGP